MTALRRKKKNKNWQDRNPRLYANVCRAAKEKKGGGFNRLLFWFLLVLFAGVCIYILFFSPELKVENIIVSGNQQISSADIDSRVFSAMDSKRWKYFSKRNFFFADKNEITRVLKNSFTRLEVLDVKKIFPNTIQVDVKERQPELVWCSGGVCYFADKEGLLFAGVDLKEQEQDKNNFLTIIDDNAKPVDMGKTKIQKNFVEYLKEIDSMITGELNFSLADNYHTPALASGEVFAKIAEADSDGWTLKLDSSISPQDSKKIIQTVLEKDISEDQLKNLDYMDISVKGKVYYKFR
jgi:citrate lyase gamma subunit